MHPQLHYIQEIPLQSKTERESVVHSKATARGTTETKMSTAQHNKLNKNQKEQQGKGTTLHPLLVCENEGEGVCSWYA